MDKELIINVAFRIIIDNGLEEFSIAKLAAELNCTKSSIYNYFKSKNDLLNEIFISKTKLIASGIEMDKSPEDMIRAYAHNCINNREIFIFFHRYSKSKFINEETMNQVKQEKELGLEVVNKIIGSINKTSVNPIIIEALIFGPIHGLIMRHSRHGDINITEKDIDDLVDFILLTIRKEME